jgi:hypothetical protein
VQLHGLAQIVRDFIEGSTLRHNWNFEAFRNVTRLFARTNNRFDRAL